MIKKFITIFFLLLFVTQVLPLRQVGQFIAKGVMTEELPETESSKSTASFIDSKLFLTSHNLFHNSGLSKDRQFSYIHFSETLPFLLASDVQTPPPNIFC